AGGLDGLLLKRDVRAFAVLEEELGVLAAAAQRHAQHPGGDRLVDAVAVAEERLRFARRICHRGSSLSPCGDAAMIAAGSSAGGCGSVTREGAKVRRATNVRLFGQTQAPAPSSAAMKRERPAAARSRRRHPGVRRPAATASATACSKSLRRRARCTASV